MGSEMCIRDRDNTDHQNVLKDAQEISKKIVDLPEIRLGLYHWALIVDHDLKETHLIFHEDCPSLNKKYILHKYDGENIPFDDESFDRIIISHSLEHIEKPEEFMIKIMKIELQLMKMEYWIVIFGLQDMII